eukprot:scaffold12476_cov126-Isochrysis_galbana.AAC.8
MAWITYGGPDGADALGLDGGPLFSFYNTEVLMHGDTRYTSQGSRVPPPSAQCTTGLCNKCSREQGFTREQARVHSDSLCPRDQTKLRYINKVLLSPPLFIEGLGIPQYYTSQRIRHEAHLDRLKKCTQPTY